MIVEPGDYVLYTIRVYNEGELNGYASKIKDALPKGLEFVTENEEYNGIWKLEGLDSEGRQVVSTTWFAKGQGAELNSTVGDANYKANLLYALKKDKAISTTNPENPDYLDAQVLCKVTESADSSRVLINYAQISDDSDENGNPIDDIDSTPDNFTTPTRDFEDDEDFERIKVRTSGKYDLVLVKEDKDGQQLNSTATFEVTTNGQKEEKTITGKLTIAKDIPVDGDHLTDDVYVIKETKAPDKYCQFDGTITVTVSKKLKDDGSGYEKSFKYTVVDSKGNDIDGKTTDDDKVNFHLTTDYSPYKDMAASKQALKFALLDDVQDGAFTVDEDAITIRDSNNKDVKNLFDMYHVLSDEGRTDAINKILEKSGLNPQGEFYLWVAKSPVDYYQDYVLKNNNVTVTLPATLKVPAGTKVENDFYQIDFGNAYKSNLVSFNCSGQKM